MPEPKRRFVNHAKNDWGMFPESYASDKSWMKNSGFVPEDLPADIEGTVTTSTPIEWLPEDEKPSEPQPVKAKGGRPRKTNQPI